MTNDLLTLTTRKTGALGDRVHARNPYGQYDRPRTTPTNPNTTRQQRVRTHFAATVARWGTLLTHDQRLAWVQYARRQTLRDLAGTPAGLTGQTAFIRANVVRPAIGFAVVVDPPTRSDLILVALPTLRYTMPSGVLVLIFANLHPWAFDTEAGMSIYVGKAVSNQTNFYAGPFRRGTLVRGSTPTPPTIPRVVIDPWGDLDKPRKFFRYIVFRGDGRVSTSYIQQCITV